LGSIDCGLFISLHTSYHRGSILRRHECMGLALDFCGHLCRPRSRVDHTGGAGYRSKLLAAMIPIRGLHTLTAVMLLVALAPLPYGYYTLLRIITTGVATIGAYSLYQQGKLSLALSYGLVAILFNPFFPIHLPRGLWGLIDVCVAGLFLVTGRHLEANRWAPRSQDK
jgi:hypothetical protein